MQSIDWMDQMIDVISSGVRRPFMPDQPLDWSIPTTSTRTPRVTPRTTDSSSTTTPPSQGNSFIYLILNNKNCFKLKLNDLYIFIQHILKCQVVYI